MGAHNFKHCQGFTLIELLVVMVIIGILATIGLASYDGVRERALRERLRSDMQSLVKHQELHRMANEQYGTLAEMHQFLVSPGVHIDITHVAVTGWSAVGTGDGLTGYSCGIFFGSAPAAAPATEPEILVCSY